MSNSTAAPRPDEQLRRLDRLIGTWRVTGGAEGTVVYRWAEGGFFLVQDVELEQHGERVAGFEVIGRENPFGAEEPGADIRSRFYDNQGHTFDYVYESEGESLTIWGGEKGSPAFYRGVFSPDGDTLSGAWTYPGGGGYASEMTRIG
ncbi:hypothetical protein [Streptomyces sp. NPDC014894]|uniref:hypothetical protein n=1 Tax=unclassified Streptomyces TaxID=2593676 RepID=UPI0036F57D65